MSIYDFAQINSNKTLQKLTLDLLEAEGFQLFSEPSQSGAGSQILETRFSEGELRTLCFDLDIDYEGLPGEGKINKSRELISYLERRDSIPRLVKIGEEVRSDVSWAWPRGIIMMPVPE